MDRKLGGHLKQLSDLRSHSYSIWSAQCQSKNIKLTLSWSNATWMTSQIA